MTICERCDVVVVPFPFINSGQVKSRPAVVLSHRNFNEAHSASLLAMVTTAARSHWPSDVPISDLAAAGLSHASTIRMKLFTLENALIARRIGTLASADRRKLDQAIAYCFGRR
jgi:mRNA interferase MazF